jgi:alcohol oxidase
MVILSSGALSTPQILQRSGIGDAATLKDFDIEIISHLPGVGQNYQDHHIVSKAAYRVDATSDDTGDDILRRDPETHARLSEQFKNGKGAFAWNFVDTGIKCRPTDTEVQSMGPGLEKVWKEYFINKPDKSLMYIGFMSTLAFFFLWLKLGGMVILHWFLKDDI